MHYVSLIIEVLRGRPAVVFWTVALTQAALWTLMPTLFYSAPPGEVPLLLAIGHEFVLGSYLGPPLAFWFGEIAFRVAGAFGLYALAQACIVITYWAVFTLGRRIVGTRHAVLGVLLMVGVAAFTVPTPNFGPAIMAAPLWALALLHYWRAIGDGERFFQQLLDQHHGGALRPQLVDDANDAVDQHRRQAGRRFIEHQETRGAHQTLRHR